MLVNWPTDTSTSAENLAFADNAAAFVTESADLDADCNTGNAFEVILGMFGITSSQGPQAAYESVLRLMPAKARKNLPKANFVDRHPFLK